MGVEYSSPLFISNDMNKNIDLSIIIPLYNEENSLSTLFEEIKSNINDLNWELIFINDGSTDNSKNIILDFITDNDNVKLIDSSNNKGKSEALNKGFQYCKGKIIITMDGDLQDDPSEINNFIKIIKNNQCDMVSGWKKDRKDPISKTFLSKIFNVILRLISGIKLNDFNCGFKAYKINVVKSLTLYGGLHRFIPILVKKNGFTIKELSVNHRKRVHGKSKYGSNRIYHGFFDLISVLFLNKYFTKPLHFFGFFGFILSILGFSINAYLSYNWIYYNFFLEQISYTINRPLLFFGILALIVGFQLISIGLIGELIVRHYKKENIKAHSFYNIIE